MGTLFADLRFGLRLLWRSPSFSLLAIASLGLGIGATTAIFSVIHALVLTPLPVTEPGRLVAIYTSDFSGPPLGSSSYADSVDFAAGTPALDGLAGIAGPLPLTLTEGGASERVTGELVSPNYFDVLGVSAARGRVFSASEASQPDQAGLVVLSHRFWLRRFGGQPSIVGRSLTVNGQPLTVVGIASPSYPGMLRGIVNDVFIPLTAEPRFNPTSQRLTSRGSRGLILVGRLRPGASIEQARAQLALVAGQLQSAYPAAWTDVQNQRRRVTVLPESALRIPFRMGRSVSAFLAVLLGTVGLVLLVACANVAGLLVARGTARRHEVAVRLALGAGRWRVVRQLLAESTGLAACSGLAGVLIAWWTLAWLTSVRPPIPAPVSIDAPLSWPVLAFAAGLAVATGFAFGLAPALASTRVPVLAALQRQLVTIGRLRRLSLRNLLVVSQVALSLLLLIVGGLFVRSLQRAAGIDTGYDTRNVVVANVDVSMLVGRDAERGRAVIAAVLERMRVLPGVTHASFAQVVPLSMEGGRRSMTPEGYTRREGEDMEVPYNAVSPGYLDTVGVRVTRGRDFTADDREGGEPVIIVSEGFAAKYFPGQDPLTRRVSTGGTQAPWARVVGVVSDTKYMSLADEARPIIFLPFAQHYRPDVRFHVKSPLGADLGSAVRQAVREAAPGLPVLTLSTLEERTSIAVLPQRLAAYLLGSLGTLALVLAAMGLYGVLAQLVAQRTREIGIRAALGASRRSITGLVVADGAALVAVGLGIGFAGAVGVTRVLGSFLHGVSALDPPAFAAAWLVLCAAAGLAMLVPVRRARAGAPATALRYE
jgi:predicted permease